MLLLSETWTTRVTEMAIQIAVHPRITIIYCNKPWSQEGLEPVVVLGNFLCYMGGIHKQNALRAIMKSCLCFIRTEFPGKNYLWAGKLCVPALCVCVCVDHPGTEKDQNSDNMVKYSSDNEPFKLISVQGSSHPDSGVYTVQLWERNLPYCPHQVKRANS